MDGVVPLTGSWDPLPAVSALSECSSNDSEMARAVGAAYDDWRNSIFSKWANEPLIGDGEDSMESQRYAYFDRFHGLNTLCYQGRQMSFNRDTRSVDLDIAARGHLAGIEFVDSSIKEWSGHVAFRDSVVITARRDE